MQIVNFPIQTINLQSEPLFYKHIPLTMDLLNTTLAIFISSLKGRIGLDKCTHPRMSYPFSPLHEDDSPRDYEMYCDSKKIRILSYSAISALDFKLDIDDSPNERTYFSFFLWSTPWNSEIPISAKLEVIRSRKLFKQTLKIENLEANTHCSFTQEETGSKYMDVNNCCKDVPSALKWFYPLLGPNPTIQVTQPVGSQPTVQPAASAPILSPPPEPPTQTPTSAQSSDSSNNPSPTQTPTSAQSSDSSNNPSPTQPPASPPSPPKPGNHDSLPWLGGVVVIGGGLSYARYKARQAQMNKTIDSKSTAPVSREKEQSSAV